MTVDASVHVHSGPDAAGPPHLTAAERENLELATRYIAAVEAFTGGEALAAFLHEDFVFHELPNRLVPGGATRDRAAMLAGAEKGRMVLRSQRFEIQRSFAHGDTVLLEVDWRGTLAVPIGSLAPGDEMRARCAMVIEARGGRLAAQRNYDCYDVF